MMDAVTERKSEEMLRTNAHSSFQLTDFECPLHARQTSCWRPGTQANWTWRPLSHLQNISDAANRDDKVPGVTENMGKGFAQGLQPISLQNELAHCLSLTPHPNNSHLTHVVYLKCMPPVAPPQGLLSLIPEFRDQSDGHHDTLPRSPCWSKKQTPPAPTSAVGRKAWQPVSSVPPPQEDHSCRCIEAWATSLIQRSSGGHSSSGPHGVTQVVMVSAAASSLPCTGPQGPSSMDILLMELCFNHPLQG